MYKQWHKEYHGVETIEMGNIGFVTYNNQGTIGTVYDLYITEPYRNDGWAEALLSQLKKHFRTQGVNKVYFKIQPSNKDNSRFVEKLALKLSSNNWYECIHDSYAVII